MASAGTASLFAGKIPELWCRFSISPLLGASWPGVDQAIFPIRTQIPKRAPDRRHRDA